MRQGIHPDYKQTTIKCACGNVIETGSTKRTSVLKFVLHVTLSTPVSRNWLTPAVEWISSESVTVWTNKPGCPAFADAWSFSHFNQCKRRAGFLGDQRFLHMPGTAARGGCSPPWSSIGHKRAETMRAERRTL